LRPVHYITIIAAIALIAILYYGGNTVPPKKEGNTAPMADAGQPSTPHTVKPASFDSILTAAKKEIPEHAAGEIKAIENKLSAIGDSSQMAVVFDSLARVWQQHKQYPVAAYYYHKAGKLVNSEKKLTFAAQLFLELARKANSESVQEWEGRMAIDGFKRAIEINPDNDTAKIGLAECYIGTGQTMQGVLLLRDITQKQPENIPANLILGQQGIISGQFDKAIGRFETVLKADPKNIEARLGLAESYKGKGDKGKAIEVLEKAKKDMNNPEFSKDVDQYINSFK
jgi:lipopolysaccharide biosynthesis regulator YciM